MKKTGEFKVDRLETEQEWIDYARDLEALLLLRPQPYTEALGQTPSEWDAEYQEWYMKVTTFWT